MFNRRPSRLQSSRSALVGLLSSRAISAARRGPVYQFTGPNYQAGQPGASLFPSLRDHPAPERFPHWRASVKGLPLGGLAAPPRWSRTYVAAVSLASRSRLQSSQSAFVRLLSSLAISAARSTADNFVPPPLPCAHVCAVVMVAPHQPRPWASCKLRDAVGDRTSA